MAMQTRHTIAETRAQVRAWQQAGETVAFVPTMGNLHEGHITLVREARRVGFDPNQVLDFSFYILAAGLVGSRLFYVLGHWEDFRNNPVETVMFWRGGRGYYGGLIFAFLVGLGYVRRHRLDFSRLADLMAPSIALGQAMGRLGCFSAG